MAKKAGLGRGLDALFADVAPINEEISVLDNLPGIDMPYVIKENLHHFFRPVIPVYRH